MDSVKPLNISKPARPLQELGSTSQRRNSPSYHQATRKMIVSHDSSPYSENSPTKENASPRNFWRGRDPMSPSRFDRENTTSDRDESPGLLSPKRRASIEKLKQAGRVKSSNIFALETKDAYDPQTLPIVERPSAKRPRGGLANNSFTRYDSLRKENRPVQESTPRRPLPKRAESANAVSKLSNSIPTPQKDTSSPTKSSLARTSQFGSAPDHDAGPWSDNDDRAPTPRAIHRHNKSVTFQGSPVINEYEDPTPEPSVAATSESREGSWDSEEYYEEYSFERGSSLDPRDDSSDADLENADKTPVVLPEIWSRMSPDEARRDLVDDDDDVFDEGSPSTQRRRSGSVTSDGESRPLPPLPGMMNGRRDSTALAAERASALARNLPPPPKRASCSKEDSLLGADGEEEARPTSKHSDGHAELTVTDLDTGEKSEIDVEEEANLEDSQIADLSDLENQPPTISRESILRKVRNSKYDFDDEDAVSEADDIPTRPSYEELAKMHPDDPIPSRENSRDASGAYFQERDASEEVEIKEEPTDEDDDMDMNAIPAVHENPTESSRSPSRVEDYQRESSVLRHDVGPSSDDDDDEEDDSYSRYSSVEPDAESTVLQTHTTEITEVEEEDRETIEDAMQLLSVKDYSHSDRAVSPKEDTSVGADFMGLPSYQSSDDFEVGMEDYILPKAPALPEKIDILANAPTLKPSGEGMKDLPRPTYDGSEYEDPDDLSPPGTPESVIHHSSSELEEAAAPAPEPPVIPERRATIKTNGQLTTRASATPADMRMMAEQRRLVSAELPVPPIPKAYQAEFEQGNEIEEEGNSQCSSDGSQLKVDSAVERSPERSRPGSSRQMKLDLDIPVISAEDAEDSLGLESEFERVIEGQKKKGYLMRQNTKLVVATNRNFSGESGSTAKSNNEHATPMSPTDSRPSSRGGRSTRKPSAEQFLKTEPWNGKSRRKSQRQASAAQYANGHVPPLPGQPSALGVVNEDFAAGTGSLEDDVGEGVERGRLFVKVAGVKDLDLPMPRNDRLYFQLTLDNGLHCVTTTSLELGKNAPIGQEFELVVLNDLEFQLTLTTQLPPRPKQTIPLTPPSAGKGAKHQKTSSLTRFLTSPKKRAERERQEREAAEAEERRVMEEERRKRASVQPTAWDLLHDLVNASDGSFARAYVNLRAHEKQCFGRKLVVDVPCYNEWALESDSAVVNSVRSKRGNAGPVRRPPYVVGYLQLELLYVPKPAGLGDECMPKSMSSAVREMARASDHVEVVHESYLSQQGGDCVHWRRRFFRLQGPRLTAYHEHTQQKRAVINLGKATRLVDDKSTLVAAPRSGQPGSKGGRRKSAFAEEDEGYAYVEEGFRIRFANGETIDFYADNRAQKDEWMDVLSQVIGKADSGKKAASWTDLVLAREKAEGILPPPPPPPPPPASSKGGGGVAYHDFTKPPVRTASDRKPVVTAAAAGSRSVPSSPVKAADRKFHVPPVADTGMRPKTPPMSPRRAHRSRDAVKSMIF